MQVDLLRHGEPEGGLRYRGNGSDDPLSQLGWRQMHAAVAVESIDYAQVWSSPLRRCLQFARELARARVMPLETIVSWREIGFGAWEGLTPDDVRAERPLEYQRFRADPVGSRPPGAEPVAEFRARVRMAWQERVPGRIEDTATDSRHVLLVAHAGVIRALVADILEMPDSALARLDCAYAGMTRLSCTDDRGWRIAFINRSYEPQSAGSG